MIRTFNAATAIITGAASGIGKALALELSHRGCSVALADKQIGPLTDLAEEINSSGGKAWAFEIDVSSYSAVKNLVDEVVGISGRLDYMFNNAGIVISGAAEDYEPEDWDRAIDVNLRGVTNGIQAAYGLMITQGFGHIVNTSSILGLVPSPGLVAYTATKFAVAGLSQALRVEAQLHNVRVSVLCPGAIRTPILEGGKYGSLPKGINRQKALESWGKLPVATDVFAREAVDRIAKDNAVIILPKWWSLYYWLYRVSWKLWFHLSKKMFARVRQHMVESSL